MAVREYEIKADTTEAVQSVENLRDKLIETEKEVENLERKLRTTNQTAADTSREAADADRELARSKKDIIREIDRATGGYIMLGEKALKAFKIVSVETGKAIVAGREWLKTFSFGSLAMQMTSSMLKFGQAVKLAFTQGVNGAKLLKVALISTGIGALVVALGMVVAYWDEIKGAISGASTELKGNLELAEDNVTAQEAALEAISLQENSLKLQGKTEKEIRDLKIQQTEETIKSLEAQLLAQKQIKDSQVDAAERNRQILQGIIRFLTLPLSILLGAVDMVGKALGQDFGLEEGFSGGIANMVFDPEEIAEEGDAAIEETQKKLAKLKSTRDGYLLDIQKADDEAAKESDRKGEEASTKALAKEKERLAALASLKKETADIIDANEEAAIKDEAERENVRFQNQKEKLLAERLERIKAAGDSQELIAAVNAKYDALDEQAKLAHNAKTEGFAKTSEDKLKAQKEKIADINVSLIENETTRALAALKLKYDAEYAAAEGNAELQLALQKKYIQDGAAIQDDADEKAKEKKRKNQEEIRDLVVDSVNATIDNLLKLNEIYDKDDEVAARRAFDRSKKLQTLQAIINTAAGIMAAIATPNIGDQITGANWAKAAAVALTGATQIATIQAAQFGGGKTAGGKSPSAPQAPSAQPNLNFNMVGQSGANQLATAVGSQFNQPIRAYVVGGEINSAQEMERKRIKTASFG